MRTFIPTQNIYRKSNDGFSLIELMVTLAVAALLALAAAPTLSSFATSQQISSTGNDVSHSIRLARSEAVKRSELVSMCARNGNTTSCSAGSDWSSGWLIFGDANRNQSVDNGEELISTNSAPDAVVVTAAGDAVSGISFDAQGLARGSNGTRLQGSVRVCARNQSVSNGVLVQISASGAMNSNSIDCSI